jgi:hypothetical protein
MGRHSGLPHNWTNEREHPKETTKQIKRERKQTNFKPQQKQ